MNTRPRSDHSLLICLLALFLVNSPLNQWWSNLTLSWYAMFIPWGVIIALVALNQYRQHRDRADGD
ncbi:MAG: hypothetical protein HKN42_00210 [Granulosicoccus sp.]|nr:hypothetical protein [Granulosicoccus sp.]